MRYLVFLFFLLPLFLLTGCMTLMYKAKNEISDISFADKTLVLKSYVTSKYMDENSGKRNGWVKSEALAFRILRKKNISTIEYQCEEMSGSREHKILRKRTRERTTPMYYSRGISCSDGNCSGGGGYTRLHTDKWGEQTIQCMSDRKPASFTRKNSTSPRLIEILETNGASSGCLREHISHCRNLSTRYLQTQKGQARLASFVDENGDQERKLKNRVTFICLKRKCIDDEMLTVYQVSQ